MSYTYPTLQRMFELYAEDGRGFVYQRIGPVMRLRLVNEHFTLTYAGSNFSNAKTLVSADGVVDRAEKITIENEEIYLFYCAPEFVVLTTQEEAEDALIEWMMKKL